MYNILLSSPFLVFWHNAMMIGAILMVLAAIVLYVAHKVKAASLADYKARYDYINLKEIKNYKMVFMCLGIAAAMFINLYGAGKLDEMGVWFFVRLFISIAGGTLVGYVAFLVLEYYYPTILNRKLLKWRYTPRLSSAGHTMRLLSEEEEDVHLQEGMRAEENIFSIDYDVWVDEKSGEIKIEKYEGHLQAQKCNSCGFYTMKVVREEIVTQPSEAAPGELIKHFQCSYCKSVRATSFKISNKEPEDYRKTALGSSDFKVRKHADVELVRLEIHSSVSGKTYYEFQNVEQAQKFLEEYSEAEV